MKWIGHQPYLLGGHRAFLLALALSQAGANLARAADLESDDPGWFVRAGTRMLFNVKASVAKLPLPAKTEPYDDGFVLPDIGRGLSGKTWYWGYKDDAQVANDQLVLKRFDGGPSAGTFSDQTDDPSPGAEILAGAEVYRFDLFKREAKVGVEMGYAYNWFSLTEKTQGTGQATQLSDRYNLDGVDPPPAPYAGTFGGPGPLLDLHPSSSTVVNSTGQSYAEGDFEASLHTVKLGIWLEYPISQHFHSSMSMGYASIYTDAQWKYRETITFDSPEITPIDTQRGTIGGRDWKPGVYTQLRLHYRLGRFTDTYVGGEFQWNENFRKKTEGYDISLDFDALFALSAGLTVRF